MQHEHPLEYERLVARLAQEAARQPAVPVSPAQAPAATAQTEPAAAPRPAAPASPR